MNRSKKYILLILVIIISVIIVINPLLLWKYLPHKFSNYLGEYISNSISGITTLIGVLITLHIQQIRYNKEFSYKERHIIIINILKDTNNYVNICSNCENSIPTLISRFKIESIILNKNKKKLYRYNKNRINKSNKSVTYPKLSKNQQIKKAQSITNNTWKHFKSNKNKLKFIQNNNNLRHKIYSKNIIPLSNKSNIGSWNINLVENNINTLTGSWSIIYEQLKGIISSKYNEEIKHRNSLIKLTHKIILKIEMAILNDVLFGKDIDRNPVNEYLIPFFAKCLKKSLHKTLKNLMKIIIICQKLDN